MLKTKNIKELLAGHGNRITDLRARALQRRGTLEHVRAQAPAAYAKFIVSAGIQDGCLTIGVTAGSWAARLRYVSNSLRVKVGEAMEADIERIRIKVVPTAAGPST